MKRTGLLIDSFSPLLSQRIDSEIERRMLIPALNTNYWRKKASMNWNPWICSNWLACVKFCEHDSVWRDKALTRILLPCMWMTLWCVALPSILLWRRDFLGMRQVYMIKVAIILLSDVNWYSSLISTSFLKRKPKNLILPTHGFIRFKSWRYAEGRCSWRWRSQICSPWCRLTPSI